VVGPVVGRATVDVDADLSPFRRSLQAAAARAGRDYGDTLASNIDSRLRRTTRIFDRFWGSTLRGSRNDFLNFVGIVSAGIERLVGNVIGRGLGLIANGFENLGNVIARFPSLIEFAGGFRLIGDNIRGLGAGGIDGLVIQLLALSAAFTIGVAVMGTFAAGLSTLFAAVTALAVGIGGALFGGIVALIPAVAALGAGISVLVLAFNNMTKAQVKAFAPFTSFLSEVRDGVRETLFSDLANQLEGLVAALRPLGPFLNSVAAVFRDWVSDVIRTIGPGGPLAETFESLGQTIPGTFRRILDLVANLGDGLVGLFAAATPAADRFLDGINRVLAQFSAWTNSVAGQTAINDFLQRAIDLLGILYEIAGEVGTALGNLWREGGADAAEALLGSIRDIVNEFNTWISDQGGRDALLQWFRDGVDALRTFGTFVRTIIVLFDTLDNSFTRQSFNDFLSFLSNAVIYLASMASTAQWVIESVTGFASAVGDAIERIGSLGSVAAQWGMDLRDTLVPAFEFVTIQAVKLWLAIQDGVAATSLALANFDLAVRAVLSAVADAIAGFFGAVGDAFARFPKDVTDSLKIVGKALSDFGKSVGTIFTNVNRSISEALARVIIAINNFVARAVALVKEWAIQAALYNARAVKAFIDLQKRAHKALRDLVQNVRNAIDNAGAALRRLPTTASNAIGRFVRSIQNGASRALTALGNLAGRAVASVAKLPARFAAIGIDIMRGLYLGIVSRGSDIINYLRDLAARAAATFASILRIGSPSKVFEEFGHNIVEGLVDGLANGIGDVTAATNSLANAALPGNLNTPVGGLADQAASTGTGGSPGRPVTDVGGITIVTPYANPRLVALQLMDDLAARGK
jgi:hypothetical protein